MRGVTCSLANLGLAAMSIHDIKQLICMWLCVEAFFFVAEILEKENAGDQHYQTGEVEHVLEEQQHCTRLPSFAAETLHLHLKAEKD